MLANLLRFEGYYHARKPLFYIVLSAFAIVGVMAGFSDGITFPNVYKNSPYQVSYLVGILSLATIFSITLSVAQTFLREADTKFDAIIYATPVRKFTYLFSRLLSIAGIAILSFTMGVIGLYIGHQLSPSPEFKIGPYSLMNYLWPLLVLAIPNIIFCIALICGTAWVSRNKLTIYVSGLLIYVLYIIGSIFSNSPLIAGSAPASAEEMSLFAKLDALGMAAFFEQTKYWTALERNTQHLSLSGNFLFNRLLWLSVSLIILALSYFKFSFRKLQGKAAKKSKPVNAIAQGHTYSPVATQVHTGRHNYRSVLSFFKIDAVSIFKGIPFILVIILWTALLGIELSDTVKGDPRLGENYATTGLIVSAIMERVPFFALLVILFYSNEIIWRSRAVNFYSIESTTPVNPTAVFLSRFLSLAIIPVFLLVYSCIIGIVMQLTKGFPLIRLDLYASLFYYVGLPLLLCIVLVAAIQTLVKSRYGGLAISAVVILLTSSSIGVLLGLKHPLVRYANAFSVHYSDMNGFGAYVTAFHWQMLCWTSLAVCIVIVSGFLWNRGAAKMGLARKALLAACALVFIGSAGYIFYQTNIKHPYETASSINNWKHEYESRFKRYEHLPQPIITAVKASIDMYPQQQRYEVSGQYQLVNKTHKAIDSLLLYIDRNTQLRSASIQQAKLVKDESSYGHYWYVLNDRLQPGASITMEFSFSSGWSPFKGHTPFNSIIGNGSFIRMSRYFPSFGYETDNEITSSIEREKRKMQPQAELQKLGSATDTSFNYDFITLDAVVSTAGDQLAIGSGELVKQWSKNGRNYFRYKSDRPMPFRFAFSSARYKVKKDAYRNIPIEIYYDARHEVNVYSLISNAKKTLKYCETNFGAYPHKVMRFAEVSAFAEGFAATAYPGTIYMKEDGGFYNNLSRGNQEDVINQLAGHELSHQWWGSAMLSPAYQEGGWILTETLAKYTELMLYQQAHGLDASMEIVRQHIDIYLTNRAFSREMPLYRTTYETPHLPYNKGTVVMHQLHQLLGEKTVNAALRSFFAKHSYPNRPPGSQDLLNEIYKVTPAHLHARIDELFKEIIIYHSKLEDVQCSASGSAYELSFTASVQKFREDGQGRREKIAADSTIEICINMANEKKIIKTMNIVNEKVEGRLMLQEKPLRVVVDPYLKTMDSFLKDNTKECN